jgi:hypothetical protein
MADIYFDVDTALTEVPVNVLPLLDDTDAKTIEDAVAYNAAGLALNWHFVTSAGAYTVTAVTPTTAGDYDWTDQGTSGIYTIEIPASGGASINNDTEGYGWFTGVATGILPWRSPIYGFRAAAINDALTDGGDTLDVNVTTIAANAITATAINADALTAAKVADDVGEQFADQLLNRNLATGTDSGSATVRTVRQALRFLRNKWSISGTTLTVTKEDDTTSSWTSELTTSGAADPVTGSDPASA